MAIYNSSTKLLSLITLWLIINFYGEFILVDAAIISMPISQNPYPLVPNEMYKLQPVLLYPKPEYLDYTSSRSGKQLDNKVIYIKLLDPHKYKPKKGKSKIDYDELLASSQEINMNDIFYVKALTNGRFSHQRLKLYNLPEFYAISVYHKLLPEKNAID